MIDAYIGIGSNLDDPVKRVRGAMQALARLPMTRVRALSGLYQTRPWGLLAQPDFINAVAWLETELTAGQLLDELLGIERRSGRVRDGQRWGPRVIDLDVLAFGAQVIAEPGLDVPHPRIAERAFVLAPLAELNAGLELPGLGVVSDLLARVDVQGCRRLPDSASDPQA